MLLVECGDKNSSEGEVTYIVGGLYGYPGRRHGDLLQHSLGRLRALAPLSACSAIEKLLLAFSLVFSICSWILGVFANLVVEDHSFKSIA